MSSNDELQNEDAGPLYVQEDHEEAQITPAEVPTLFPVLQVPNGDSKDDDEDDSEDVSAQGSPISEHSVVNNATIGASKQLHNVGLKRYRFDPRQDIELLKELYSTAEKPFAEVGKASWDVWAKVAHVLNEKQIFGPLLKMPALTCKLRFELLLNSAGGDKLKYNPKRGTPDEFRNRDELIALVAPLVPGRNQDVNTSITNGKRGRGRPRRRQGSTSEHEEDDGEDGSEIYNKPASSLASDIGASCSKRKPERSRQKTKSGNFLGGAEMAQFLQPMGPGTGQRSVIGGTNRMVTGSTTVTPNMAVMNHSAIVLPDRAVVTMMVEYLHRYQQQDMAFKRDKLEARQREQSEDRRLQWEHLEIKRMEIEFRKKELALLQKKWIVKGQEHHLNLELMKKALDG